MKKLGMIRRIDELGRIVIPIEIRRVMKIKATDEMEFYIEDNNLVLKKYSKLSQIQSNLLSIISAISNKYVKVIITDNSSVLINQSKNGEVLNGDDISVSLENKINERNTSILKGKDVLYISKNEEKKEEYQYIKPININGDIYGSFIVENDQPFSNADIEIFELYNTIIEKQVA